MLSHAEMLKGETSSAVAVGLALLGLLGLQQHRRNARARKLEAGSQIPDLL